MSKRILGIVGSYRKGHVTDLLTDEVLAAAAAHGAEAEKICLVDKRIEFCRNCRDCTQEPGPQRGRCAHDDDMAGILDACEKADALVLAAPVNFFNVTAIFRRFMERLLPYAYWPWGKGAPGMRQKGRGKTAILVTATAMPAIMGRFMTGALRALHLTAQTLGARPVMSISVGMIAGSRDQRPPESALRKAREAGRRIAGA